MAARIVNGEAVELPSMRDRDAGPHWWQALTLDRESLQAPWPRPRPLRPRPDATTYAAALNALALTETQRTMLVTQASAPRRTATMRANANAVFGTNNAGAANLQYGKLARALAHELNWVPDKRDDGSDIWMSMAAEGWQPTGREFEWTMVPTLADAVLAAIAGPVIET